VVGVVAGTVVKGRRGSLYPERTGLIIWTHHVKAVKMLERFGNIHYVSRKLNYVVMYINRDEEEQVIKRLEKLNFVKSVDYSYRNQLKTEYNSKHEDKTHFYSV